MIAEHAIDSAARRRDRAGAATRPRRSCGIYDSDFAVEHKDDDSPLTAADLAAHRCIVDGLARSRPTSRCCRRNPRTRCRATQRRAVAAPLAGRPARRHARIRQAQRRVHRQHRADRGRRGRVRRGAGAGDRRAAGTAARRSARSAANGGSDIALRVRAPATAPLRVAASRSHRDARTAGVHRAHGRSRAARAGLVAEVLPHRRRRHGRLPALRPDQRMGHGRGAVRARGRRRRGARSAGPAVPLQPARDRAQRRFHRPGRPALPWQHWLGAA